MTLRDAVKSGKPFRRQKWVEYWIEPDPSYIGGFRWAGQWQEHYLNTPSLRVRDAIADDWEIMEDAR